jgi:exopolysaccharide production protein ExoZ
MNRQLNSLQYMRGVAAALVVLAHSIGHPLSETPFDMLQLGRLGVTVFFVISGFIMVAISGEAFSFRDFLSRRAERIIPLYWAITIFAAALALALPSLFKNTAFTWTSFVQSLLFIPHSNPAEPALIQPLVKLGWTLNYEAFFYICFAACCWLSAVQRVVVLSVLMIGLTCLGLILKPSDPAGRFYLHIVLLGFVGGMWLGLAYAKGLIGKLSGGAVVAVGAAGLASLVAAFAIHRYPPPFTVDRYVLMIMFSAAALLVGAWVEDRGKLFESAALRLIGNASYAIYLAHMFWIAALVGVAHKFWGDLSGVQYLAVVVLSLVGGLGGGVVVYLLFDKPVMALLKRLRGPAHPRPIGASVAATANR